MLKSQNHPVLSLRQWRFFLFCLLAGHQVDSADCLREAQVRRQGGYTQGNLSFHPSEKKHPASDGFANQPLIDMKFVQLCIYLATATKASCNIWCFFFWSMQWVQMPRGWHRTGCQVAPVRRGWDCPMTDKDGSSQPSTGHSWAHSSAFPTGKAWVRMQNTAQSQGWGKKCDKQQRQHTPKSARKELFHMVPKQRIHSRLYKAHMCRGEICEREEVSGKSLCWLYPLYNSLQAAQGWMQRIWEPRTDAEPGKKRQHAEKLVLLLSLFLNLYFFIISIDLIYFPKPRLFFLCLTRVRHLAVFLLLCSPCPAHDGEKWWAFDC